MSEKADEAPKLTRDEAPKLLCGFCRKGDEAKDVCGKLWTDREKGCTAHQRCMVCVTTVTLRQDNVICLFLVLCMCHKTTWCFKHI